MKKWRYNTTIFDLGTRWRWVVSPFTPRKRAPRTLSVGGCVGCRVGLDAVQKRKISWLCQELNPGRPARSSSLYRLRNIIHELYVEGQEIGFTDQVWIPGPTDRRADTTFLHTESRLRVKVIAIESGSVVRGTYIESYSHMNISLSSLLCRWPLRFGCHVSGSKSYTRYVVSTCRCAREVPDCLK
jgi:hypothetical protein